MANCYKRSFITVIALATALISVSCSRFSGSVAHLKNLDCRQVLVTGNIKTISSPKNDIDKFSAFPVTITTPPTPSSKENHVRQVSAQKSFRILAQIQPKLSGEVVLRQTAAVRNLYSHKHISSYSGPSDTGGFLGLAVLCFIASIVLAYFGFTSLAALLWVIAVICLIAAIIFFILWLIGRAAAASD